MDFTEVSQEPWKLLRIIIQHGSEFDTAFHCEALRSREGMQNETTLAWVGAKKATWFHVAKIGISSHLVVQARWDLGDIAGHFMVGLEHNEQYKRVEPSRLIGQESFNQPTIVFHLLCNSKWNKITDGNTSTTTTVKLLDSSDFLIYKCSVRYYSPQKLFINWCLDVITSVSHSLLFNCYDWFHQS